MRGNENKAGIYIHIPFCKQACHYCNFHFSTSLGLKEAFIKSLIKELETRKNYLGSDSVQSIYFGGGTPSLLSDLETGIILDTIYKNFSVTENAEITLEANPDDISLQKLKELKTAGINRLSIGIQSFHDRDLLLMNRAHNAMEAVKCLQNSFDAGFDNITADLIYGIPGLTQQEWEMNIKTLLSYPVEHISCYALTIEPKTVMQHMIQTKKMSPPDEERTVEQFNLLVDLITENKFEHYEISNFARNKKYSIHNSSYWFGNKYLGAGPSAHSFNGITRQWNVSNNAIYINSIDNNELAFEIETLTPAQKMNERIMTSLRTMWGFDLDNFILEFGHDNLVKLRKEATKYFELNYLEEKNKHMMITKAGKFISDKIISDLFFVD
ncbi:MAG: radical SAM family heme chaperone HemW [Chitinophagales bacterium]